MGLDNPLHLIFLLLVLLLVFGARRLPEMGRSLGAGMRGFKDAIGGDRPAEQPPARLLDLAAVPAVEPVSQDDAIGHGGPTSPTGVAASAGSEAPSG